MVNKFLAGRLKKSKGKSFKGSSSKGNSKTVKSNNNDNVVVNAADLKWKPVEIPDTLDDFEGFYGLEEIDGVGVKIVGGQVQFVAHDDTKINGNEDNLDSKDKIEIDEDAPENDLVEFKNMDDMKDGELTDNSQSESEAEAESEAESEEEEEKTGDDEGEDGAEKVDNEVLKTNVFNTDIDLEDITPSDLPEWTEKVGELSFTTLHGLTKLGFNKPTLIQEEAIPMALKGEDIMGKASTGSGKTLAYGIPIIEKLMKSKSNTAPIGLIFTPTRELAKQVTDHLRKIASLIVDKSPHAILSLTGGLSIQKQERLLKYEGSGRIVVATPGRFLELIEKDKTLVERFSQISTLVLDEADRLLQDGHFDEFENILKYLGRESKNRKHNWQTMIFSATFATDLFDKLSHASWKNMKTPSKNENEMEIVLKHLMTKIHFKSKPILIDANPEDKVSSQIKESLIECAATERDLFCYYFVSMYPGKTLIFCNAIDSVKKLTAYLNNLNISCFQIHSSMTQKNRLRNLERYQQQSEKNKILGKPTVLVGSDVAARGLDIPGIQHVIHYHLPRTADVYIHRSGRTARANNEGVSVMICSPEEAMGPLRKLRKTLANKSGKDIIMGKKKWQKTVTMLPIDDTILSQLKERSRLASELADHDLASSSLQKDDTWMKKAAEDLGVDIDSDDEIKDTFLAKNINKKRNKTLGKDQKKVLVAQLNDLLKRPLRKDMRQRYLTGGLVNLADSLVKKRGHDHIIGHEKTDALETLKNKKRK
ncbi:hypothetical protein Kpol_1036p17 [Vanderwaltozyma polyspora DSM 70294]|uniref:ATP-dependent RNA helicase MAK5 n=1 Tax=Vanderwaltozyma polyspora (strain ATCC 22028 / DSM 70294 / BCRC 21397 / CBS 2163 / NBRC 10782 / NRRL Y-8283 / UCD 57-17) TaxID=436907 RepID=MAK5_VANPO|nr:uncharacterized protein Kpol_1036p17 [Vanderwaltozyma polyspora DSM 70294]A7TEG8.1 RecName: Full=ATP-dependent RNA helicase MAK5 [Vanderwaltozyma polyspora DSM 70294]EDO19275.1 hypothetical protein Kpol_1036p17 [Vanderwaltozyma polyspora DSM 70294]